MDAQDTYSMMPALLVNLKRVLHFPLTSEWKYVEVEALHQDSPLRWQGVVESAVSGTP